MGDATAQADAQGFHRSNAGGDGAKTFLERAASAHALGWQPRDAMSCEQHFEPMQPTLAVFSAVTPSTLRATVGQRLGFRQFQYDGASEDFLRTLPQVEADTLQPDVNAEHNGGAIELVLQPVFGLGFEGCVRCNYFIHGIDAAAGSGL
jgi:hypothetical protein